jgi:hypothetical protein
MSVSRVKGLCVHMVMPLTAPTDPPPKGTRPAVMGLQSPSRRVPARYCRQAEPVCWSGVGAEGNW